MKKNEQRNIDIKHTTICIMGVQEGEKREKGAEKSFTGNSDWKLPKFYEMHSSINQINSTNPSRINKEIHTQAYHIKNIERQRLKEHFKEARKK